MPLRRLAIALALALLFLGAGPRVEGGEPLATDLRLVRAQPGAWLGRRVDLVLQMKARVETWNPYATRFGPGDWLAFEAWDDAELPWEPAVFANPHARLFVRRGGEVERRLRAARPHDRLRASALVREVFLDEPWIEVEALLPIEGSIGPGTLVHVGRALDFQGKGQWELALAEIERARSAPLPQHALDSLAELAADCERLRDEALARQRRER
jgi:hypothetical protein